MTTNGLVSVSIHATDSSVSAALLAAEATGQLPTEAWPLIRDLLLATSDPTLAAAIAPLRHLIQARQAIITARQELDRGYAAVAAVAADPSQLVDAAAALALLADELSARAQQLAALTATTG